MDKELPKDKLGLTPRKAHIRVTESHLPGIKACKASVAFRDTIGIDDLAQRIVDSGSYFRKESLISSFRLMVNEIYNATNDGFNVDFGLGRTDVLVDGPFESVLSPFDKKLHTLVPRIYPSPRLKQYVGRIPAENYHPAKSGPRPSYASLSIDPFEHDNGETYNHIPAGRHPFVSIYGDHMKLAGDLPGIGLTIRCLETGESYFYTPHDLAINTGPRLCFNPDYPFTPGEWEAVVTTQLSPQRHLYKTLRSGSVTFTVDEARVSLDA